MNVSGDDVPAVMKGVNEALKLVGKGSYDTSKTLKMEDSSEGPNELILHGTTASMT